MGAQPHRDTGQSRCPLPLNTKAQATMTELEWDDHFISMCVEQARLSADPSTRVGAVLVSADRRTVHKGVNGFAPGVAATAERMADREVKLKLVVHAEMNAILAAARDAVSPEGATLYFVAMDRSGRFWGGAPCARCANAIIASGIVAVKSLPMKHIPSRWLADCQFAAKILAEAGVPLLECSAEGH